MRIYVPGGILLLCQVLVNPAHAATPNEILGEWITEDRQARVEIFRRSDRYFGKIVSLMDPYYGPHEVRGMDGKPRVDLENPDKSLRQRPVIGLEIVRDFGFDEGIWRGGTVYDPANGKTYKGRIWLDDDGTLNLRGYVGLRMLGRTSYWQRPDVYFDEVMSVVGALTVQRACQALKADH